MASSDEWVTRGFDAFSRGTLGNAGQHLYVSVTGVLQRIHLFDLNRDGHVDILFCNSQEHLESPPAYVYTDALNSADRIELDAAGAITGIVADLNGDGWDDLVLGNQNDGVCQFQNSFIYYGSPEGLTRRYCVEVPTPGCTSVAAGDFDGDGRPDLAFALKDALRIFTQTELGFERDRFVDLDVGAAQVSAADLDGDGFADLYCLMKEGPPRVFWGGPGGIDLSNAADVLLADAGGGRFEEAAQVSEEESVGTLGPLAQIVTLDGQPHLFAPTAGCAFLVPVTSDRGFGEPLVLKCPRALSVDVGDVNGDGHVDLILAARDADGDGQRSWVYWGGPGGFLEERRTPLPTMRACDVAVGDLDGDGRVEIVFCQDRSESNYSIASPLFKWNGRDGFADPVMLPTEGARRVFIARTSDAEHPQVVFANRFSRGPLGDAKPVIYWGASDGFSADRRSFISGLGATSAACCDVNDDGRPDILISNCAENAVHLDPGSYGFLGTSEGFSEKPDIVLPTKNAMALTVGDLNRDGYLDVIYSSYSQPELLVFFGSERGFDAEHPQRIRIVEGDKEYLDGRRMLLADLNNDGWLDLVITFCRKDRCFVLWGGPDGFDFERRQALAVFNGSSPTAADLTGNGYLDLIVCGHAMDLGTPHNSFATIYWNGPDGLREDRRMQLPISGVLGVALADFNNDGLLDMFVGNYTDRRSRDIDSYIYWGEPGSVFSPKNRTRLRTHSASGCLAADFNEDGWIDLAVCNHKTYGDHVGDSFVFWNGPGGFDEKRITRLPTVGSHGMVFMQPGNIRDRGPEEYYVSEPFELRVGAKLKRISWNADVPDKTWVHAQLRFAETRESLEQTEWTGPDDPASRFECGDGVPPGIQTGSWLQYRLALGALNSGSTPRVREVRASYE